MGITGTSHAPVCPLHHPVGLWVNVKVLTVLRPSDSFVLCQLPLCFAVVFHHICVLSLYLYRTDRLKIEVCIVPLRCKVIEQSLHDHVCIWPALQFSCLAKPGSATRGQWLQWGWVHRFIISLFYIVTDLQICIKPQSSVGLSLKRLISRPTQNLRPQHSAESSAESKRPSFTKLYTILDPCMLVYEIFWVIWLWFQLSVRMYLSL